LRRRWPRPRFRSSFWLAVVATTSRAAEAAGVGHLVDSVEAGKKVDLLIVDGDLNKDIAALRASNTIMLGGQVDNR
jgi:imidazolonepropionase-like amidohydrolase